MKDDVFGVAAMKREILAAASWKSDSRIPIQPRPADLDPAAWAARLFFLSVGRIEVDYDIYRRIVEVKNVARDAITETLLCGHLHEEVAVLIAATLARGREEGRKEGIRLDAARRAAIAKTVIGPQRFRERPRRMG